MSAKGRRRSRGPRRSGPAGNRDVEGGAELHSPDLDPRAAASRSSAAAGVFELDREVAAVEADLHVLEKRALRRSTRRPRMCGEQRSAERQQPPFEEVERFAGVLDRAIGLRLDVEVDEGARLLARRDQRSGDARDVAGHDLPSRRLGRSHPGLVGERGGGDPAVDAGWQQRREDADQVERVADARRVAPVRCVDAALTGVPWNGP